MILFIIALVITAIGILLVKIDCDYAGITFCTVGGIVLLTMILIIFAAHTCVGARIERNKIKYDSLCERYKIVTSEYEDVSKSDVIKDIAEWNMEVHDYKYWAYNPWTNLFYSRRVADELNMIEVTE